MNNHKPRVSIGMPVYNGERYVEEALDSVLAQTHSDFELIISDNASTDRTQEICTAYAAEDERIRYFRNRVNLGAANNYNRVFELSSGEYFKWAAADDALEPEFLAQCVELLDKDPTIILAYPRLRVMDDYSGTGLREGTMRYDLLDLASPLASDRLRQMLFLLLPTVYPIFGLIRASILKQTGLIGPYVGADHALLVELIVRGRFGEVPKYLMRGRWHRNSYGGTLGEMLRSGGREGAVQAEWYDPANKGKVSFPHWRRLREYFVSIIRCNEVLTEKMLMMAYLCGAVGCYRARLRAELGDAIRECLSHTLMGAAASLLADIVELAFILPIMTARAIFRGSAFRRRWLRQSTKSGPLGK